MPSATERTTCGGATGPPGPRDPNRPRRATGYASSLRGARKVVADTLADVSAEIRETTVLLAGELVMNALTHGGGRFGLRVMADAALVRVEVRDATATQPRVLPPDGSREHGRGMAIVDALASAWGSGPCEGGKVVWFEIRLPPPA